MAASVTSPAPLQRTLRRLPSSKVSRPPSVAKSASAPVSGAATSSRVPSAESDAAGTAEVEAGSGHARRKSTSQVSAATSPGSPPMRHAASGSSSAAPLAITRPVVVTPQAIRNGCAHTSVASLPPQNPMRRAAAGLPAGSSQAPSRPATAGTSTRSGELGDLGEQLAVLPAQAGILFRVRPAHDAVTVDQDVGALREELLLKQCAVPPAHLAPEVAQEVEGEVFLRLELLERGNRIDADREDLRFHASELAHVGADRPHLLRADAGEREREKGEEHRLPAEPGQRHGRARSGPQSKIGGLRAHGRKRERRGAHLRNR